MEVSNEDLYDAGSSTSKQYKSSSSKVVEVKDVWFIYQRGDNAAGLKGVNMTVEQSTIYGLLGASGCGKSTLISTMVGLRKPHEGDVRVFGFKPTSKGSGVPGPWIGFMPQETCLLDELTIEETLSFFSTLNHVPKLIQQERITELKRLLDLPDHRLSKCLSGGQKRRLSLAVALVHNPPLIILDEPTVGADPILRTTIWKHLRSLVEKQGKTVFLSTHYIEEARAADRVGLMRDGRLLVEENPNVLMSNFSTTNLEEVFLKMCINAELSKTNSPETSNSQNDIRRSQENGEIVTLHDAKSIECEHACQKGHFGNEPADGEFGSDKFDVGIQGPTDVRRTSYEESNLPNKSRISSISHRSYKTFLVIVFGIAWKNITLLRRNIVFLLITFLMPISNFLLINTAIGYLPFDLPVAVVSREGENLAKTFLINHIEPGRFNVIHLKNLEDGIQLVRLGQACAAVHIPDEFSVNMFKRFRLGVYVDNKTLEKSQIHLYQDKSNLVIEKTVYVSLLQSFMGIVEDLSGLFGLDANVVQLPILFEKPIFGKANIEFNHAIVRAVLPETLFLMSMVLAALVFVNDRVNGFLSRCEASGLGSVEIISAHFVVQNVVLIFQISAIVGLIYGIGVEVHGTFPVLLILFVLSSYLGMACGVVISVLAGSIHAVMLLVVLFHLLTAGLGGVFWPVEGLPLVCSWLSFFHPQSWLIRASRKVIDNGIGLTNIIVWSTILYSLFTTTLLLGIAIFIYRDDKLEVVQSILSFKMPHFWYNRKFRSFLRLK